MAVMKFELEQVLRYRRDMEKMRKNDFALAKQELDVANDLLEKQKSDVSRLAQEFNSKHSEFDNIDELSRYVHFFAKKREDILHQKEQIEYLDTIMNERRVDLLDATKDKKVLESLKDKKTRMLRMHLAQKERDFMDELSVQKNGGKA